MSAATNEVIEYPLCKSDVTIDDWEEVCAECDMKPATKTIMLDFRAVGTAVAFGQCAYCDECAMEIADRIRSGLPEAPKEEL